MPQNLKTVIAGRGDKYINLVDMLSTIDMLQTTSSNKSILKAVFTNIGDKYITITTMTAFLNLLGQLSLCQSSEVSAAKNILSNAGNKIVTLPTAESMFDALPSLSGDEPAPSTVYDYYIGWSDVTDDTAFAALSDAAIKANTVGYNKSTNPSYTGSFGNNKKVIYVLYKNDSTPVSALLDGPSLDTPFTAEDIQDADSWFYRHSNIVIDDVSYLCVGYGDIDLDSNYSMTVSFA